MNLIYLLQNIQVPKLTSVNEMLSYALGVLVFVVGFLYREKAKELKDLKNEHKEELKDLQKQVNKLYDDSINDLKMFDKDKTQSIIDFTSILNKQSMLLEQIKTLINDKR